MPEDQLSIEEKLKKSEESYRDIVENSLDLIHSVDEECRIVF